MGCGYYVRTHVGGEELHFVHIPWGTPWMPHCSRLTCIGRMDHIGTARTCFSVGDDLQDVR